MATVIYINDNLIYMARKHFCPACNVELKKVKMSQIVGDCAQDGQKESTLFSDTRIGRRGVQFRKYKYIGGTKYVWKEFDCEQCGRHFTVTQMKTIESAPQERKKELLAHFDASPKQENEPVREIEKGISKSVQFALGISISIIVAFVVLITILVLPKSEFVDTNGPDNFALTEITREDILKSNSKHSAFKSSVKHSGYPSKIIGITLEDYDYDTVSYSYGRMNGICILQATKIAGNSLTLNINSIVESGNAEIVILIDGAYYCSVDVNQSKSLTLQGISNKEVLVKLAGEGVKIKIDVSRKY